MIMAVNGITKSKFPTGFGPQIFAGVGVLLHLGETCQLESNEGAVIIAVEATKHEADLCGISMHPKVFLTIMQVRVRVVVGH